MTPHKRRHVALLLTVGHPFVLEGLEALHGWIIVWAMGHDNDIRPGRHSVFRRPVHWVFVTKYRREVFTKSLLDDLRGIFTSVCADFEAERGECDGRMTPFTCP